MWDTAIGKRILFGGERRLVVMESWALRDAMLEVASDGGANFRILLFDRFTWRQPIFVLDQVLATLVEPTIAAPFNTARWEATVAAIYAHLVNSVQLEIDSFVRRKTVASIRSLEPQDLDALLTLFCKYFERSI